ncbi:uncharacterized protein LOC144984418 [Oryzias latipes]
MQSVIENLLEALSKYSSDISNDGVPNIPCTEQFENSGKDGHADHKATYQNLVEYQKHVEALDQLPRRDSLVEAAVINQDLLQHLKQDHDASVQLSPPLPPSNTDMTSILRWKHNVSCWMKQVEELKNM